MDWYQYYLRRIETRPDQRMAINSCRDMAIKLFEKGPLTWSIESGAALLSALHEANLKTGINVVPVFNEVEEALFSELQGVRLDLEADLEEGIRRTGCGNPNRRNRNNRKGR